MTEKIFDEFGDEIISCRICGGDTTMKGTKLCDRCWELEKRISMDKDLARKILDSFNA
jgi:hypothetical protein